MRLLHRFILLFVLVLVIFSLLETPQVQAEIGELVTDTASTIVTPTETVIEEVSEEVSEEASEKTGEVIEEMIEEVYNESPLIEPTTTLILNEMEAKIEEVSELIIEPEVTIVESNLESELIQPETKEETELQPNLSNEHPTSESIPIGGSLTEARPTQPKEAKAEPDLDLELELKLDLEPKLEVVLEAEPIAQVPEANIQMKENTPKNRADPKPNKIPVPMGIMASYTVLPHPNKQGSQNGSHNMMGSPDAALTDNIQIKVTSKRHLVTLAKLIVSNRANEPPGQPPKHPLFLNSF